ncbi:TRAP transporter large permease [Oceanibaculum pacificum]|uniref:TRAP transporter large permease protein n=1 Tax=Oceanibaculum pacificum TaxID=580166 RepID=A0A154W3D0_9PROT|nr:TRAP transporter large permease [Oceanibaculum pacificum]KZD07967.1 C4-dicarboxylate ABC transporter permease [Oceanibaculum pacificum]
MMALTITLLLLALLAIGTPVGFALGIAGSVGLYWVGGFPILLGILETTPLSSASSYELITVPMFMLMAEFIIVSGIAERLFQCAAVWVGRVPGGLGISAAIAGAGFGAICGSSTASAATLSATSIPAMMRQRYDPEVAGGIVAITGTLAMLIPPSVALILYGLVANVSIGKLLIAGIVPGILVTLTIILTILALIAINPKVAPRGDSYTMREKFASLRVVGPVLMLFLLVTGVIYLGVATPTEAAGLGAFGAFVLAIRSGRLTWSNGYKAVVNAAHTTCMIVTIIMGAHVFGYFFTITQVTPTIVSAIGNADFSPGLVLALIIVVYLILGCFMDQVAILILTVPVTLPVVMALGYDPVWFGIIVIVAAEVGMVTPPLGLNVFVVSRYTGRPVGEVFRGVAPHVLTHLILLAILASFPEIILWFPSTMK